MSDSQSAPGDQIDVGWANQSAVVDFTDSETPHDRVLVVGETRFYVYAGQLSACSEFFRTMFSSDFKEKDQKEVEIKDVDAEGFYTFLKLFHPFNTNVITKDNFQVLVEYSHRFLARFPFTMCEEFILSNSSDLDVIVLLEMAFKYDWKKLKEDLKKIISLCSICKGSNFPNCWGCRGSNPGFFILKEISVVVNKDRIAELPAEIQAFILQVVLDKASSHR